MPIYTIQAPDGHEIDIDAPDEEKAKTGAQQWYAQNVTNKTDTSYMGALSQGASDVASGFGKTIKHYLNGDAGNAVLNSTVAKGDPKYKSATEGFMRPEDGADAHVMGLDWSKLPRAMVEQAPGLVADLAVQALVPKWMGPVGKYAANALTFGGRTAGSEAEHRVVERTGDPNAEPALEDKITGLKSTATQAALNQYGLSKIVSPSKVTGTGLKGLAQAGGNVVKAAAAEGGTNAAQDLVSQGMAKQGTDTPIDWGEFKGSGVLGAAGGGIFSSPRGAIDASIAKRTNVHAGDEHTQMAANRLLDKVQSPKDLENPETAYKATTAAREEVKSELADVAKGVTNAPTDVANAISRAQDGVTLMPKDLALIDSVGNERLSSLARQSHEFANLIERGNYDSGSGRFAGGAHDLVRKYGRSALVTMGGLGAIPHVLGQGGVGLDTLASSLPGAAEGVAAGLLGYKALKALDKVTGASSPARTFAEKFGNGGAVRPDVPLNQSPTGPKVVPQNSVTTPQPWGPIPDQPQPFKPDMLDSNLQKIVDRYRTRSAATRLTRRCLFCVSWLSRTSPLLKLLASTPTLSTSKSRQRC